MKAKVKLIKKEDRNGSPPVVEAEATADPKDWSTAVKSWVTEFQKDRQTESLEAFDSLFSDPTS
jgi:thioredoxin-like negative regulator of GroEL